MSCAPAALGGVPRLGMRARTALKFDWRGLQVASIWALLAVLGLAWFLTWQRMQVDRGLLVDAARLQQQSLTAIASENLAQVVDRGRMMTVAAEDWFATRPHDVANRLGAMIAADQAFLRLALYDRSLRRVYSSSPAVDDATLPPGLEAGLRSFAGRDSTVDVLAGPPLAGQAWQVPLLFPVRGRDEGVAGYLLVIVDMGYFLRLYRNIDNGTSGVIHILLATDGSEIAEARAAGLVSKPEAPKLSRFAVPGPEQGVFEDDLCDSGARCLSSYRRADRTPFVVVVSRDHAELLAGHQRSSGRVWMVMGALSVILLLAAGGLLRSMRSQQVVFRALQQADRDKHALINQLEEEKCRALELASNDHLTGLHNRRMFNELAASHLEAARRSRQHYALMYLDLDRFKLINDTLGHHVGDLLLHAAAQRLRENLRGADIVGRMGGDEFAVLVTRLDSTADMAAIAGKVVAQISQPYHDLDGHEVEISASAGIAFFPRDGHDVSTLCRHADAAMYESKRQGRGRFAYYDSALNRAEARQHTLERQLPRAIADGELVLHFQPKVRLSDFRIVGLEALVRWNHPDHGLVYPNDFIPLAEQAGLIVDLGNWVMQACCAQQAQWHAQGVPVVPVAFNVSPRQLRDEGLPRRLAHLLAAHGLGSDDLELEITESCLVEPREVALEVLREVEALGIRIGLDDFGSGFSSLSQIRDLPIKTLKIDRSFVNDIRSRADVGVIVTSIITLAHNLKLKVVAEGVELQDQLVHLKTAGCDEVQGYYLSRPVAAEAASLLLRQSTLTPA